MRRLSRLRQSANASTKWLTGARRARFHFEACPRRAAWPLPCSEPWYVAIQRPLVGRDVEMSKSPKTSAVSALDFLDATKADPGVAVYVAYGDDVFLKTEAVSALRRRLLAGGDEGFAASDFVGDKTQLRDVRDALSAVSLFGSGRRVVIVTDADSFVTRYRSELEDYVAKPTRDAVLVLEVTTWPANTRLAKAVAAAGQAIDCAAPSERKLKPWLIRRAKEQHQVQLDSAAADALSERIPPEPGVLVQELAKLVLLAGENRVIDERLVRAHVGGWRTRTTWEMIDLAADGRATEALLQLDRLMLAGEKPHGVLPQLASTLRRFGTAVQLIEAAEADGRRLGLRDALSQAGVIPFKLAAAEHQLRQIGRSRAKQLTRWLLAADLAMKGHNSADDRARVELERLIVRLASAHGSSLQKPPNATARR